MKKIVVIEAIVIVLLSFAVLAVNQYNNEPLTNSPYKMTKYDFLYGDKRIDPPISSRGYDEINDQLWNECGELLDDIFHNRENGTSLICSEAMYKRIDMTDQEMFRAQLDDNDKIISNVSVISVEHTEKRAVAAYAFDVSIADENCFRKYNCFSNESCPYFLCMEYRQDKGKWEIVDILVPA